MKLYNDAITLENSLFHSVYPRIYIYLVPFPHHCLPIMGRPAQCPRPRVCRCPGENHLQKSSQNFLGGYSLQSLLLPTCHYQRELTVLLKWRQAPTLECASPSQRKGKEEYTSVYCKNEPILQRWGIHPRPWGSWIPSLHPLPQAQSGTDLPRGRSTRVTEPDSLESSLPNTYQGLWNGCHPLT